MISSVPKCPTFLDSVSRSDDIQVVHEMHHSRLIFRLGNYEDSIKKNNMQPAMHNFASEIESVRFIETNKYLRIYVTGDSVQNISLYLPIILVKIQLVCT